MFLLRSSCWAAWASNQLFSLMEIHPSTYSMPPKVFSAPQLFPPTPHLPWHRVRSSHHQPPQKKARISCFLWNANFVTCSLRRCSLFGIVPTMLIFLHITKQTMRLPIKLEMLLFFRFLRLASRHVYCKKAHFVSSFCVFGKSVQSARRDTIFELTLCLNRMPRFWNVNICTGRW